MVSEFVDVARECSKMCGLIQDSYFLTFDWMFDLTIANWKDIFFMVGILGGFIFAIWRTRIASKQAATSKSQLNLAEKVQQNDRFSDGRVMLSSDRVFDRTSGVSALAELAVENPKKYLAKAIVVICEFIREVTVARKDEWERVQKRTISNSFFPETLGDIRFSIAELSRLNSLRKQFSIDVEVDLSDTVLPDLYAQALDLGGVTFSRSFLARSQFIHCDLTDTDFTASELFNVRFVDKNSRDSQFEKKDLFSMRGADFTRAKLVASRFIGADLKGVNFTSSDISNAIIWHSNLDGVTFTGTDFQGADIVEPKNWNSELINESQAKIMRNLSF